MFILIPSDANDPQGLMRRKEPNKQTNKHGITALVINFLTSNQLLVNIKQLFETLEEKK